MVSLAFVISFVVSAVAMLIGIVIFTDVTDAMGSTFLTSPESTVSLGQNGVSEIKEIPTGTIIIGSTYSGLITNGTSTITEVVLPIAGVSNNYEYNPPLDILTGEQPSDSLGTGFEVGQTVYKWVLLNSANDGLFSGQIIDEISLETNPTGSSFDIHLGIYNTTNHYITQSDILSITPDGNYVTFIFNSPIIVPPSESFWIMVGSDLAWSFQGTANANGMVADRSTSGSNTSSVIFPNLPSEFEPEVNILGGATNGKPNMRIQLDSVLPKAFEVGLYDSSLNLIGVESSSVTTDNAQDLTVTLSSPVQIPLDGIVSVGLYGDSIEFLGDSSIGLLSSGVSGIEDPFVLDPSTQVEQNFGFTTSTLQGFSGSPPANILVWRMNAFTSADGLTFGESINGIEIQTSDNLSTSNILVALYDSSNNLLVSSSVVNVLADGSFVNFPISSIPVPADEFVRIMVMSDTGSSFLGTDVLSSGAVDTSNTFGTFPSTWIHASTHSNKHTNLNAKLSVTYDGTIPQSQRTIIQVFSAEVKDTPSEFVQANNIALTVLGVLPVALFFGLFTILSPRVDE